jgi:DNA repair exonuclease SbcCD ATPase subunit
MTLRQWQERVAAQRAEERVTHQRWETQTQQLNTLKDEAIRIDEARTIIQTVAQDTQKELEYHVSELTTLALASVFPDPYKLTLSFDLKRGRTEATLSFERGDGNKVDPMSASGGGPVDIAAFALRVTMWSLSQKTIGVIVLDEPFRFLSLDLQERAADVLLDVSKKLGLQFLMVTHEAEFADNADNILQVRIEDGVSYCKQVKS